MLATVFTTAAAKLFLIHFTVLVWQTPISQICAVKHKLDLALPIPCWEEAECVHLPPVDRVSPGAASYVILPDFSMRTDYSISLAYFQGAALTGGSSTCAHPA